MDAGGPLEPLRFGIVGCEWISEGTHTRRRAPRRAPRVAPRGPRRRRALRRAPARLAPHAALRRPQATRRDRVRLRRRPPGGRLRRAEVRAGRLRAGRDPEPARGAAAPARRDVPLHLARPRCRPLPLRPHRRPLPGRLMELGDAETVFSPPHHPHTEALLLAVPTLEGEARASIRLEGEIPSLPSRPRAASSTRGVPASGARSASARTLRSPRWSRDT
jgi:hypothetical protein